MMARPYILILVFCGFAALPTHVMAQDKTNEVTLQSDLELEDLSVDFDDSFNEIGSHYLSDSMMLNYQINLLNKLAERQGELLKISDSFASLGIPFNEPAPARTLCEQLPPNAPCIKHYPDLYQPLVSQRRAYYDNLRRASEPAGMNIDMNDPKAIAAAKKAKEEQARKIAEAKAKAAAAERAARYQWNEVSCVAGQCTGVLIDPKVPGYRTTVHVGTRLADGTLVDGISKNGVHVIIDGDPIAVRPSASGDDTTAAADSSGVPSSVAAAVAASGAITPPANVSMAVDNAISAAATSGTTGVNIVNLNSAPKTASAATPPAAPATTTGPVGSNDTGTSTVEPALGPSGLF